MKGSLSYLLQTVNTFSYNSGIKLCTRLSIKRQEISIGKVLAEVVQNLCCKNLNFWTSFFLLPRFAKWHLQALFFPCHKLSNFISGNKMEINTHYCSFYCESIPILVPYLIASDFPEFPCWYMELSTAMKCPKMTSNTTCLTAIHKWNEWSSVLYF